MVRDLDSGTPVKTPTTRVGCYEFRAKLVPDPVIVFTLLSYHWFQRSVDSLHRVSVRRVWWSQLVSDLQLLQRLPERPVIKLGAIIGDHDVRTAEATDHQVSESLNYGRAGGFP